MSAPSNSTRATRPRATCLASGAAPSHRHPGLYPEPRPPPLLPLPPPSLSLSPSTLTLHSHLPLPQLSPLALTLDRYYEVAGLSWTMRKVVTAMLASPRRHTRPHLRPHLHPRLTLTSPSPHPHLAPFTLNHASPHPPLKQVAAAIFASPPTGTYAEAKEHFATAETTEPGFYVKNRCHHRHHRAAAAPRRRAACALRPNLAREAPSGRLMRTLTLT